MIKRHEYSFSFLLIVLVVTIANLHNVFGLDILLQDDNFRYRTFLNDDFWPHVPHRVLGLYVWIKWSLVYVLSNYSVQLARLLILLVFMLPLSCLNYVFNRRYLGLSVWVSLGSAILINIIPKQFLIPAFLDGSYPVIGALAFFLTLIAVSSFLQSPRPNHALLVVVAVCWLFVCDVLSEMVFFLFPAILYYTYSAVARRTFKLRLYGVLSLCTSIWLVYFYQTFGWFGNRVPVKLTAEAIASRMIGSFDWWLPFDLTPTIDSEGLRILFREDVEPGMLTILAAVLVFFFLIVAGIKSISVTNENRGHSRAFVFYGICASCAFPFWFLSPYVTTRHFYLAYLALTTLMLIAMYQLCVFPRKRRRMVSTASLVAILSFYSVQRFLLNRETFKALNQANTTMLSLIHEKQIDADTQVTFVNMDNSTHGYPDWSTGHLQYQLKMPGITGVIGDEMIFYDPFNMEHCDFTHRMSCLDSSKKLIAFKQEDNGNMTEMKYFLRWISPGDRESEWTLFGTNSAYEISEIERDSGFQAYENTLSRLGISPRQVLWGNYEDEKLAETMFP